MLSLMCLLVCMCSLGAYVAGAQTAASGSPMSVSGVVLESTGVPAIGAFVLQRGTSNGTMTDVDGKFTINVTSDAVLEVTLMGFETQLVPVNGNSVLSITLKEDSQLLEEVVVVGYGTTKKVNLTGAVSVIKADDLQDRSALSASKMLQGSVPGLTITNRSGRPGQSSTINVRGVNSINGGSPLVLIDGVEGDLERVNPQDIESISVLKDAASADITKASDHYPIYADITFKSQK
jgi:outer membrane receptor protein involved in Fe transport